MLNKVVITLEPMEVMFMCVYVTLCDVYCDNHNLKAMDFDEIFQKCLHWDKEESIRL